MIRSSRPRSVATTRGCGRVDEHARVDALRRAGNGLQVDLVDLDGVETALEARELEQLVDQPAKLPDAFAHDRRRPSLREQLAGRDDAGERRAQLVRGVSRELALASDALLERLRPSRRSRGPATRPRRCPLRRTRSASSPEAIRRAVPAARRSREDSHPASATPMRAATAVATKPPSTSVVRSVASSCS